MDRRLENLEVDMGTLKAKFSDTKVVHLRQTVHPIPAYNASGRRLPIPKCFPSTALRLYRLQDKKNCMRFLSKTVAKLKTTDIHILLRAKIERAA